MSRNSEGMLTKFSLKDLPREIFITNKTEDMTIEHNENAREMIIKADFHMAFPYLANIFHSPFQSKKILHKCTTTVQNENLNLQLK